MLGGMLALLYSRKYCISLVHLVTIVLSATISLLDLRGCCSTAGSERWGMYSAFSWFVPCLPYMTSGGGVKARVITSPDNVKFWPAGMDNSAKVVTWNDYLCWLSTLMTCLTCLSHYLHQNHACKTNYSLDFMLELSCNVIADVAGSVSEYQVCMMRTVRNVDLYDWLLILLAI